jgi:hypothetical protein
MSTVMESNLDTELESEQSAVRQRLGQIGRAMKKVDVRKQIVAHPFAAVGIAAAAGAIVGFVRPKPQPGRVSSLLITTLGAITFRLVREAAVRELGQYAKNYLLNRNEQNEPASFAGTQGVEGGKVRYTPAL